MLLLMVEEAIDAIEDRWCKGAEFDGLQYGTTLIHRIVQKCLNESGSSLQALAAANKLLQSFPRCKCLNPQHRFRTVFTVRNRNRKRQLSWAETYVSAELKHRQSKIVDFMQGNRFCAFCYQGRVWSCF